jgi:diguanylate cyclase (GGDEF)-like protein
MQSAGKRREELSIIVVDDMKFSCEFIRKSLQEEGYGDVRVAVSASEALTLLEERPCEVLLADWVMPEMDGLALTDRVRQLDEERNHYTCVLLLTAREGTDSMIEAFDRGVDDYLTKPPDKQELAARIYTAGRIANQQNGLLDAMQTMREGYEQRITIDGVTGMGNRLDAERRFGELIQMVESRGGAACCGLFSLNDSEALLSSHGEEAYHDILRSIATRFSRSIRPNDLVARISDGEFVVGMYYQDEEQFRQSTYKRILQAVNLRPIKTSRGFATVNGVMGVSCCRKGYRYEQAEELIAAAAKKVEVARASGSTEIAL